MGGFAPPSLDGGNIYSAKNAKGKRGTRSRYVDVMNTGATDGDGPKIFDAGPQPLQSMQPTQFMQPMQPAQFTPSTADGATEGSWS